MIIKKLLAKDAAKFWALRLIGLQEQPEAFGASYTEESVVPKKDLIVKFTSTVSSKDSFILGAFGDYDNLVGIVGMWRNKKLNFKHKAEIMSMYVDQEARGMGIGKALMKKVIELAAEIDGIEQLNLTVMNENMPAKRLYESIGFQEYGLENKAMKLNGSYFDDSHMVLFLDKA